MVLLIHFRRTIPINKRLAPNLRHLIIEWDRLLTLKSFTEFVECDLLISLMKFKLRADIDSPHFLRNFLPTLSSQCSYSIYVKWFVKSTVALPETSKILSNTCETTQRTDASRLRIINRTPG